MNEMTELVLFIWTLPRDPAGFAMLFPQPCVDAAIGIEGCHEDIGDFVVAFGMTGFAGEHDAELPELRRQRGIQDRLALGSGHIGKVP